MSIESQIYNSVVTQQTIWDLRTLC